MNPTLIKANIALFNGSRAEARRLLRDYQAQTGSVAENGDASLVLWLTAQAQDSREARVDGLRKLLETVPANDPYARLASQYLADEQKAEVAAATDTVPEEGETVAAPRGRRILGVALWKVAAFVLAGVVLGVAITSLFPSGTPGTNVALLPTAIPGTPGVVARGTPLPDLSTPIPPELHQAEYPRGIVQVSRIEDGTLRAADERGNPLTAVAGARFVALKLVFECRAGICSNPPEADLALFLDDGSLAGRIADAGIAGEELLQSVGQSVTTTGWVVFEVPNVRQALALAVLPFEPVATPAGDEELPPQLIPLPGSEVEVTPDVNNP